MLKKMPKLPRSDNVLVFLSSDPATLGLPSLRSGAIYSDSLKSDQDILSSFIRFAQIRWYLVRSTQIWPFLVRLGSDLLNSGDIPLDSAPLTQIDKDKTSPPPAVTHHRTRPNRPFAHLSPANSTRGGWQLIVGLFLFHSTWAGRVWVEPKTDLDQPVDSPNYYTTLFLYYPWLYS